MSARYFLDTNIFIYHLEALDSRKFAVADRLIREGVAGEVAYISFQVVQECLNTVLSKAEIKLDADAAKDYLDTVLAPLFKVPASLTLYHRALELHSRYRFSFYDSLVVAAALESGCTRLYSEDLQHGQRVGNLTVENPFIEA